MTSPVNSDQSEQPDLMAALEKSLCEHEWARLNGRRWCPKCGADGGAASDERRADA